MSDARVEVLPIPRPAIIVIHNVEFPDDPAGIAAVTRALEAAAGHNEFVLFRTWDDGTVKVVGDPADAVALIEAAVRQQQEGTSDGNRNEA